MDAEAPQHHIVIDPLILYFGTPVVLISSINPDGSDNLMPMSSAFWLNYTAILGLGTGSQTSKNLRRTGECVLNLPSADLVTHVTQLRSTTGENPVSAGKAEAGYHYEPDKFGRAGLKRLPAETVAAARVAECPVNLEARVVNIHPVASYDPDEIGGAVAVEVKVTRVHVHPEIRIAGTQNRIDPDRWRPLIMSFGKFYGLGDRVHPARLASDDRLGVPPAGTDGAAEFGNFPGGVLVRPAFLAAVPAGLPGGPVKHPPRRCRQSHPAETG